MVWKKIIRREVFADEQVSFTSRTFNYKRVDWVRLHLECGHVKTVRNYGSPDKRRGAGCIV